MVRGFFFGPDLHYEERVMKLLSSLVAATLLLGFVWSGAGTAASHGGAEDQKVGILLVAFGSSQESAQVSFENIDEAVKATYPDIPVRWAYTSHIIRKKLAKQGKMLDSPEVALARMADEGFTHVAVQSLHTIAGSEYHDLRRVVSSFSLMGGFERVLLGNPLLATQEDMARTVDAILSIIPAERKKEEGVVLMGHGTHHPSNAFYAALMFQVQLKDPNIFIGTVEGYPELDTILPLLKKNNIRKIYLMPFMSVAGDHAKNDMASAADDSWKSLLSREGIEVVPILKGTAEYEVFVDIWVDHLGVPLSHFK
jgi:sirohydrochlorin cobaltochelatase